MFHLVASAVPDTVLFRDATEVAMLWHTLAAKVPGYRALYLMPTHLHALHVHDVGAALGRAMWAYARWRNARRGERGSVWQPRPAAHRLVGRQKQRRSERYILLNGCRAHLESDPLAWTFSSLRDALGFAWRPVRPPVRDPVRYLRWVSSDPSADPHGTPFPIVEIGERGADSLVDLLRAVSAYTRTPLFAVGRRGPARTLFVRSARTLTVAPSAAIGDVVDLTAAAVRMVAPGPG